MNGKQHTVRGLCYGLFLLTAGLCLGWYCLDREVSWWILLVVAVLLTVGFRRLFPRTVRAHCYSLTTLLSLGLSAVGGRGLVLRSLVVFHRFVERYGPLSHRISHLHHGWISLFVRFCGADAIIHRGTHLVVAGRPAGWADRGSVFAFVFAFVS